MANEKRQNMHLLTALKMIDSKLERLYGYTEQLEHDKRMKVDKIRKGVELLKNGVGEGLKQIEKIAPELFNRQTTKKPE